MCDTILAGPDVTAAGVMLFGKNSDRQRNEAHIVEMRPGGEHPPGETAACTYIAVPQARRTYAALFCRPFWTWGPEMGANAHGLVIGNEAVHTRGPPPEAPALLGMDLLGLTLQRAADAEEAVAVMGALLAAHGQGGNCGHVAPFFYNNSYIVADPRRAFVVETVGREWLAVEITGARAISNIYGVARPDRVSAGLDALIAANGWPDPAAGGYAGALADADRPDAPEARGRQVRAQALLDDGAGALDLSAMMRVLRDHGPEPGWRPGVDRPRTVCMHAADDRRGGQTTGAMVSDLTPGAAIHWVTATAAPCLSVFRPVTLEAGLPPHGPAPAGTADPESLWWRHEAWHRAVLADDFAAVLADFAVERDALEADFRARTARSRDPGTLAACWAEADALEARWAGRLTGRSTADAAYRQAWAGFERAAGR